MLQYERHQKILDILDKKHTVSFHELAKLIYVSEATLRRDIASLENSGHVTRVYGGVTLSKYKNEAVPIELRESENSAAKEQVAASAAKLISDGDTIIIDSSSTARRVCRYIKHLKNITVITNNLRVLYELKGTDVTVYCTGGTYYDRRDCFLGPQAESFIKEIYADILFFSSQGISESGDITDVSEAETSIRRIMMSRAAKKVFLCDSSKPGIVRTLRLCGAEDVDEIICDIPLEFTKES